MGASHSFTIWGDHLPPIPSAVGRDPTPRPQSPSWSTPRLERHMIDLKGIVLIEEHGSSLTRKNNSVEALEVGRQTNLPRRSAAVPEMVHVLLDGPLDGQHTHHHHR